MKNYFTILGSGSSLGVPRIDGNYGSCNPNNPKNNRNEPSYLNHIVTEISILLDTDEEDIRNESFKNTLSFFQSVN